MTPSATSGNKTTGRFARTLGALFLRFFGWRVEGDLPPETKAVVIAAPHTSNWDMPFMLAVAYVLGVRPSWLGKRELFRWPFGGFMRWLGGLPVDRRSRNNVVQQVVDLFAAVDRLFIVIPPSATRSRAPHWKSGFYHIARGAGVPVMCTFLDYRRKVGGVGPIFHPSGNVAADMDRLRAFYDGIQGRFPHLTTPVRLPEEDAVEPLVLDAEPPAPEPLAAAAD
jgi:1-acyl-sn-glycerol-3-phosphate acyltransferase